MPAMLPNGAIVETTPTSALLQITDGMNNITIAFVVTEVSSLKTTKNGNPYVHVIGRNDDEEPLRIRVWGKTAVDNITATVKLNGLHEFRGLSARAAQPMFSYGQLPFDLNFNNWSEVAFIRGDYALRGLPLTNAADIVPETAWRLRVRGTIVHTFNRYMRYPSGLSGMLRVRSDLQFQVTIRSVPMAFVNSFTANTEIEIVGHLHKNGNTWDFDVLNWADVHNVDKLVKGNITVGTSTCGTTVTTTPQTPPTPLVNNGSFFPETPKSHKQNTVVASVASNGILGLKSEMTAMIIQPPLWSDESNCWSFFATITHEGKQKALRVISTAALADIAPELGRGSTVTIQGIVKQSRTGLVMDADAVRLPAENRSDKPPKQLPSEFSEAASIDGTLRLWHKIRVDIISSFTVDDDTNVYSGTVVVHNSSKTITVHLKDVPNEVVPELCLFAELELIGQVTGDDENLQMTTEWKHAAIYAAENVAIANGGQRASEQSQKLAPSTDVTKSAECRTVEGAYFDTHLEIEEPEKDEAQYGSGSNIANQEIHIMESIRPSTSTDVNEDKKKHVVDLAKVKQEKKEEVKRQRQLKKRQLEEHLEVPPPKTPTH